MTTDFEREVESHYKRNFCHFAAVHGCWGVGWAFVSVAAIVPVFLSELGASKLVIGLAPAIFTVCLSAPQLLAARLTARLPIKKYVYTCVHYPGTVLLLILACVTLFADRLWPGLVIGATLAWLALLGLSISFASPMWVNLQAKLYPARMRGRLFAYVFLLNNILGAIASMGAAEVLKHLAFPANFALLFAMGGVLLTACVTTFLWLREPARDEPAAPRGFVDDLVEAVRSSAGFRWYLVARFFGAFSLMGVGFYAVAGVEKLGLSAAAAGKFGAALMAGQVMGSLVAGHLGDRFGFKLVAVLVPAFDVAAAGLAIAAPNLACYYLVFVLYGLRRSCAVVGMYNLTIEFCPTADKTAFIALGNTVLCPAFIIGPILGGLLAEHHPAHYDAVFVATMACCAAAFVMLALFVREPRRGNVA